MGFFPGCFPLPLFGVKPRSRSDSQVLCALGGVQGVQIYSLGSLEVGVEKRPTTVSKETYYSVKRDLLALGSLEVGVAGLAVGTGEVLEVGKRGEHCVLLTA